MISKPFGNDILLRKVEARVDRYEGLYIPVHVGTEEQAMFTVEAFGIGKKDKDGNVIPHEYPVKIGDKVLITTKGVTILNTSDKLVIAKEENLLAIIND